MPSDLIGSVGELKSVNVMVKTDEPEAEGAGISVEDARIAIR